ncbi:type II secretion system protein GspG [Shigella sonnei]
MLGNKEKADWQKAISDIVALENALDTTDWITGVIRRPERAPGGAYPAAATRRIPVTTVPVDTLKRLPKDPWGNDYQVSQPG